MLGLRPSFPKYQVVSQVRPDLLPITMLAGPDPSESCLVPTVCRQILISDIPASADPCKLSRGVDFRRRECQVS